MIGNNISRLLGSIHSRGGSEPKPEKQNRVTRSDISELSRWRDCLETFLLFEDRRGPMRELTEKLEECCLLWRRTVELCPKNEAAKAVLAAYRKEGGIRDLIEEQRRFAEDAGKLSPELDACAMGYSTHMFYLRGRMRELDKKYKDLNVPAVPPPGADGAAQFIASECASVAAVCDVPKAWSDVKALTSELAVGDPMTAALKGRFGKINGAIELLRSYSDDTVSELERVRQSLAVRVGAMENSIAEGGALYEELSAFFTEDWFASFDPESERCQIRGASAGEVGIFYARQLSGTTL